jgi:diguanylate cyclase (GGDEF)-like protein
LQAIDARPWQVASADGLGFDDALAGGQFDLAVLAGQSIDELARVIPGLDLTSLAQRLPVILVLSERRDHAAPQGAQALPCGIVWRRDFSNDELLAAVAQAYGEHAFMINPDGVLLLDANRRVLRANPAARRMLELTTTLDTPLTTALAPDGQGRGEWQSPAGRVLEWEAGASHCAGLTVLTLRDAGERREATRALAFRAEHDALTGLANQKRMRDELQAAIARADRDGGRVAVLYLDLDGFKQINDTFGHAAGDAVLVGVAQRLMAVCRAGELVARIGGDELVMVAESFPLGFESRIAERVLAALVPPIQAAGRAVRVGVSIGVAVYPDHASDATGLVQAADEAMYEAKRSGRDTFRLATGHADVITQRRQELAAGLEQALLRREFEVLYQPLLDLRQGRFVGAEALLRWHRPRQGMLHPGQFLDVAETSGLITGIGDWMLDHVCQQLAQWRWALGEEFFLCANVSVVQLRRADFAGRFRRTLQSHGLTSAAVRLEVSERVMAQEMGRALGDMTTATDVHLAVDDVSQGMLSLRNISSLPIRSLKIDRSLVAELPHNTLTAQLVDALIAIGRTFGLSVVAEGVETTEQLQFLRERGCDYAQGFLLSAPVSAAQLPPLVNTPALLEGLLPTLQ